MNNENGLFENIINYLKINIKEQGNNQSACYYDEK